MRESFTWDVIAKQTLELYNYLLKKEINLLLFMRTDLHLYDNTWYNPGGGSLKRVLWYFANILF